MAIAYSIHGGKDPEKVRRRVVKALVTAWGDMTWVYGGDTPEERRTTKAALEDVVTVEDDRVMVRPGEDNLVPFLRRSRAVLLHDFDAFETEE